MDRERWFVVLITFGREACSCDVQQVYDVVSLMQRMYGFPYQDQ